MKAWVHDLAAKRFPKGKHSQAGQEGILDDIFRHVPTANEPPVCVEFGFNADTLEGGSGSNVAHLVLEKRWQAFLFDDCHENRTINLRRQVLTTANIVETFETSGVPQSPDYISIDIDSTDLWMFQALLPRYRASVYSVEYNSHFPLDASLTLRNDLVQRWGGDRGYGASLGALADVAGEHGYSLVAVEPMFDAFFVRNDLLADGSGDLAPPRAHWRRMTSLRHHVALRDPTQIDAFLDYRVWSATGDLAAARKAAADTCRRFLLENGTGPGMLSRFFTRVREC